MVQKNNTQSTNTVPVYLDPHWAEDCAKSASHLSEIFYPLNRQASATFAEKCLSAKSLLRLKGNHSGEKLDVVEGAIWVTQLGSPDDILLNAGESLDITHKNDLLIQGMAETHLKVTAVQKTNEVGGVFGNAVQSITGLLNHLF